MKEYPILFSGEMVRQILAGKKTQTRRVYKKHPDEMVNRHPIYNAKDRLWVRETFAFVTEDESEYGEGEYIYKADADIGLSQSPVRWKPSIFMPRAASRITLEVVRVGGEPLQSISEEDAISEGCHEDLAVKFSDGIEPNIQCVSHGCNGCFTAAHMPCPNFSAKKAFAWLWDSINGKNPGRSWDDNPWVWVIEFKVVDNDSH